MDIQRFRQVCHWGWKHAGQIAADESGGFYMRVKIFFDMLYCFRHYKMWSNQYKKESFHKKSVKEREAIGAKYYEEGKIRDAWQEDFREGRKFLLKYTQRKYELAKYREERNRAYAKRFNAGEGLMVEHGVEITRQHYLNGSIKIGKNVLLAKNVFIDYSGELVIGDNVQLTNGVIIETHHHAFHSDPSASRNIITPTSLMIGDGAVIGSRAIILASCHYIGKHARIGAGAVVTKDVPDFAVVAGVPAKVIRLNADRELTHLFDNQAITPPLTRVVKTAFAMVA